MTSSLLRYPFFVQKKGRVFLKVHRRLFRKEELQQAQEGAGWEGVVPVSDGAYYLLDMTGRHLQDALDLLNELIVSKRGA